LAYIGPILDNMRVAEKYLEGQNDIEYSVILPAGLTSNSVSGTTKKKPVHSVFFGPFLSGCFFPPENPLLVLFMLAQKCLWTLKYTFLNSWIIWEAVGLEISELSGGHKKFCPETLNTLVILPAGLTSNSVSGTKKKPLLPGK
jgi:hypothetical protein